MVADVLERLNGVFCEVFEDDGLAVSPATSPKDIEGWDSLHHVSLVVAVENEFGITLRSSEVGSFKTVGELAALIERHL
jgi:acyl carrier protein